MIMANEKDNELLFKLIIQGQNNIIETMNTIDRRVDNIDKTMAVNTQSLEEHMKRSDLLEKQLAPVRLAYDWIVISCKVIGVLALIVTIVGGAFTTIQFLSHLIKG